MNAVVRGRQVQIGDEVWFKDGYEQSGTLVRVKDTAFGSRLVLEVWDDEDGEYRKTTQLACDCWLD